jgi:ribonuclease HI
MKKMERERGVSNARKPIIKSVCYANEDLMREFNEMMIRIKRHLFGIPGDTIKPENEELDRLTNKVMKALKKETEPTIHYYE